MEISSDSLHKLFEYVDGNLIRKTQVANQKIGTIAGKLDYKHNTAYVRIYVNYKPYYSHRLIYKMFNPNWNGSGIIDHITPEPIANNRIENLRLTTHQNNIRNMQLKTGFTSQFKGVSWDVTRSMWRSSIQVDGKQKALGRYTTEREAAEAYNKAAVEYFGEYCLLNKL